MPTTDAAVTAEARVLVVDDEPNIRELLSASLRFAGFEVEVASDGHQALQLVGSCQLDLIVLDVMMPGIDGFEVVRRMREMGAIRITAWIGPHVCGRCYEVPEQMRDDVTAVVPAARATTSWGTPALDIGAGVRAQLEAEDCRVLDVSACTRETSALYSHRRDGAGAGRLAGLIRRRP